VLKVNTTVIAVIAPPGVDPLDGVGAANVRVRRPDPDLPALDRAVAVWDQARGTAVPYLLHDADPLAVTADTWVARFEGGGTPGALEVAVATTLARWRARSLDLPDYYLLASPDELGPVRQQWFVGFLGAAAPNRVVTVRPGVSLLDHLSDLRPGPWWPELDRLLAGADHFVPDTGELVAATGAARLVAPGRADELALPDGSR
jgi:hypothetical protein